MAQETTDVEMNGRELVEQNWPYDGPHSEDTVIEAARAIDELTRYLGNATGPGNGKKTLPHGAACYRLLGALSAALSNLDQVLLQLATAEGRTGKDALSYDDRRDRPASDTTSKVVAELHAARKLLAQEWPSKAPSVCSHLQVAHSHASHIGYDG